MLLTQDQEMIRDAVRDFAQSELWPHAARWDREHQFPKEAHQGLAALGAYGICVPEELGGAGLDYLSLALVLEEIAAGDGGTSTVISVTNCPVNAILLRYGNPQQQRDWLAPLARGEMLGAFCLTEPHVGSDLGNPIVDDPKYPPLRVEPDYIDRLEGWCVEFNEKLEKLTSFILPLTLMSLELGNRPEIKMAARTALMCLELKMLSRLVRKLKST